MRAVYISGPISGVPGGNSRAFALASCVVLRDGDVPLSPVAFCSAIPAGSEWRVYMRRCLQVLSADAECIAMLPGWWRSRGACVELLVARCIGLPVRFFKSREFRRGVYGLD